MPFSSVQSHSCVQFFVTQCTAACQASLSITNSQSLLRFMLIESVMTFNHLIFCHPLLLLSSIFPSMRVFSDELVLLQSTGVSALYVCSVQRQKGMPLDRINISAVNSNKLKYKVLVLSYFIRVWLFATPWTIVQQATLSMGILQARILEWVAMPFSRGSSWPTDQTCVSYISCIKRQVLYH